MPDEVFREGLRLRVAEQALDLGADRPPQLPPLRQPQKLLVRHAAPEEVGQAAGQRELVELPRPFAQEEKVRRDQDRLQSRPQRPLKRCPRGQLRPNAGDVGFDLPVRHRPPERAARERAEDAAGVGNRVLRDHLHAPLHPRVARLSHAAEEHPMARRGPVHEGALELHPLDRQPRTFPFIDPDLGYFSRAYHAVDGQSQRLVGLEPLHHLHHRGRVRGDVVVADQLVVGNVAHAAFFEVEGYGFSSALVAVGGDADAIPAREPSLQRPEGDLDVRVLLRAEDRHGVVEVAVDGAARLDRTLFLEVESALDHPRPRPVGDRRVERQVRRLQVSLHQERRRVKRLAHVVEAVRRGVRREPLLEVEVHPQEVAQRVLVLDAVEPAEHRATVAGRVGAGSDRAKDRLEFLRLGLLLLPGRHLAATDAVVDQAPAFAGCGEDVEPQPLLGLLGAVAIDAVADEEALDLLRLQGRGEQHCVNHHPPDYVPSGRRVTQKGEWRRCAPHPRGRFLRFLKRGFYEPSKSPIRG